MNKFVHGIVSRASTSKLVWVKLSGMLHEVGYCWISESLADVDMDQPISHQPSRHFQHPDLVVPRFYKIFDMNHARSLL